MIDILAFSAEILTEASFTTERVNINDREALVFEDATVVGFLFTYGDSSALIRAWDSDANRAIADYQFGLRRSGQKAWNTYLIKTNPWIPPSLLGGGKGFARFFAGAFWYTAVHGAEAYSGSCLRPEISCCLGSEVSADGTE